MTTPQPSAPRTPALRTREEGLTFHTVDELKKLLQRLPIKTKERRLATGEHSG